MSFFGPSKVGLPVEPEEQLDEPRRFDPWREIAGLAWIGIELIWVALWFSGLSRLSQPISLANSLLVLGGLLAGSHYLARLFEFWQVKENVRRWLFAIFLVICLWLGLDLLYYAPRFLDPLSIVAGLTNKFTLKGAIPIELGVILFMLFVAWRGVALAKRQPSVNSLMGSFQFGALMIIFYGILLWGSELGPALAALYLFLFISLAGMGAARLNELGSMRGGKPVVFSYRWLAGISLSALIVVILGLISVWLLQTYLGELLARGISFVLGAVTVVLGYLLLPLAKVLYAALMLLASTLNNSPFDINGIRDLPNSISKWIAEQGQRTFEAFASFMHLAKPFILWGIVLAVIVVILMALRWQSKRARRLSPDSSKDLLSMGDLLKNLGNELLKRAQEAADILADRFRLSSAARLLQAARVRWVYYQLMALSTSLGRSRRAAVTPLEFLPTLNELFPEVPSELALITQSYNRVRYGEMPESQGEVDDILKAWVRIQALGKKLK